MPPSNLRSAVEALLFSSDQPLTLALLGEALETTSEDLTAALQALGEEYQAREAGVELREMSGGWVVMTRPEQAEWITRMLRGKRKTRLSRAALETMAIIAYKQPVTKSEVEAIRGVDASGVMATLLERNLVTIKGRSTVVGRPLLYGSTPEFLNYFGLKDLTELPRPEELRALVAAREPEQMEMMELDPESGMPVALAEGEQTLGDGAAVALLAEGVTAAAAETMPGGEDVAHTRAAAATDEDDAEDEYDDDEFEDDDDDADEDDDADAEEEVVDEDAFSMDQADALLVDGVADVAEVGGDLKASDADADEDDDESYEDDESEDEDDKDEDEFDDDYEDDDEDEDDDDDGDAEDDESHPEAHLTKHDDRH